MSISGTPIDRTSLPRMEKRISFLYVERAVVNRDGNGLTVTDNRGTAYIPATQLAVVLLGPGTRVTHAAMALLGDSGVSAVWVGEKGVRYYAHGRPPAKTAKFAEAHARIWSHQRKRLDCAKAMYQMRFPGEDVSGLTMAQLRGREGARMKRVYAAESKRTGVYWDRRLYDKDDFEFSNPINRALNEASAALYGISHAVIVGLGFIPALGIVHSGTDRSFVYDIADLYKADISIPAAFDSVAEFPLGQDSSVRRRVRDRIISHRLIPRMVDDLQTLMHIEGEAGYDEADLVLWSDLEVVPSGSNWHSEKHEAS